MSAAVARQLQPRMLQPLYAGILAIPCWLCLLTAVISLVLGYPLAYALVRSSNMCAASPSS